jgi:hypothetical protein
MDELLKLTQGQPFIVVALTGAIWAMYRSNAELIAKMHQERNERLDKLEMAIAECERDRKALWEKMATK